MPALSHTAPSSGCAAAFAPQQHDFFERQQEATGALDRSLDRPTSGGTNQRHTNPKATRRGPRNRVSGRNRLTQPPWRKYGTRGHAARPLTYNRAGKGGGLDRRRGPLIERSDVGGNRQARAFAYDRLGRPLEAIQLNRGQCRDGVRPRRQSCRSLALPLAVLGGNPRRTALRLGLAAATALRPAAAHRGGSLGLEGLNQWDTHLERGEQRDTCGATSPPETHPDSHAPNSMAARPRPSQVKLRAA